MNYPLWCVAGLAAAFPLTSAAQPVTLASTHPEHLGGFGSAAAPSYDLDGDLKPDILVGALNETVLGQAAAGRVYMYGSVNGNLLRVLRSPTPEVEGWFGGAVTSLQDMTGDGRAEIAVGAFNENNSGLGQHDGTGRVYIFNGATGALLRTINSPNPEAGGAFGFALTGLADINGDGKADLAVGAWKEDPGATPADCGKVYVFSGANGAVLKTLSSPNQSIVGGFGESVCYVPDLTGDGKQDLLIGAMGESPGGFGFTGAGRAYVFNPVTGASVRTLVSPNKELGGLFSRSVAFVPDTNADGKSELLIGAPDEDPGASPDACGRAYMFSGANGALLKTFAPGVPEQNGGFGFAVSGIPDINLDNRGDVAIGAIGVDPIGAPNYGGRVYLYSGANGAFIKLLASPKTGEPGGFGTAVVGLADANGNGKGEVVVGSPSEDTPTITEVGRAYLFRN